MGLFNIGTLALNANMVALQTIGNNIANANTVGYSRQSAVQSAIAGQFTGAGYVGKGVSIETIKRNYDAFLTRQATVAATNQAADVTRSDYLGQLSNVFRGGTDGIGASINDMLNAFSDVATTPTDLTARTVVLTRIDETARRMRAASQSLDDLQTGIAQSLKEKVTAVNTLAQNISEVNEQIARTRSIGQPANDLLDKRDQLIRDLNQYVQTTTIPADDGTLGVYIGGSQALVLGVRPATLAVAQNAFGDPDHAQLVFQRDNSTLTMDENTLGGGELSGLLRFHNSDLVEGRNLLGRLTTAVTSSMNTQHALGLDLSGQPGTNLFSAPNVNTVLPSSANTGAATLQLAISDPTQFVATNYQVDFTTATTGTITRSSDNKAFAFDLASPPVTINGLTLSNVGGAANPGDSFFLKPFASAANNVIREFSVPSALAVASPIVGQMGTNNTGSLQLSSLATGTNPPSNVPVTLTFTSSSSYTRSDMAGSFSYTSGQAILGGGSPNAWTLKLQGAPRTGDGFTVANITATTVDPKLNGGNASAMMALRDRATFDGAALTDGYAGLIAQIGIRAQSANYSAAVSTSIATNSEKDRAGVSGVNLDEEAAKLLQYQQAYQASAKMIQIAQSIFDTLIQNLAR